MNFLIFLIDDTMKTAYLNPLFRDDLLHKESLVFISDSIFDMSVTCSFMEYKSTKFERD